MPNWCYSNVEIVGSEASIDRLEKEFDLALSKDRIRTDFSKEWLGNLLLHIGMSKDEVLNGDVRCRGAVTYFAREAKDRLVMDTETAWVPHMQCIKMFVDHYADDAAIFYRAEEPGCCLFWSNDDEYIGHVFIDHYPGEGFPEDLEEAIDQAQYCSKTDVVEMLEEYLGHPGRLEDLESELNEQLQKINADLYVSCNEYQNVPVETC